jgi:hypothetical protein
MVITILEKEMSDTKFSIVVPTMWKFNLFPDFLVRLVELDSIGEIVIINNDMSAKPTHSIFSHPKIKMHDFKINSLVNPAWNYGVGVSLFDNVCIMNDDLLFDLKIFKYLEKYLVPGRLVVYAQSHSALPDGKINDGDHTLELELHTSDVKLYEIGSLMFMKRLDYVNIPAGLDFFLGDIWIWDTMKIRFDQNYYIKNLRFYTPHRVTSNTIADREFIYVEKECKLYPTALTNFKNLLKS